MMSWYDRARSEVMGFLHEIDPDMTVEVCCLIDEVNGPGDMRCSLVFLQGSPLSHAWCMTIREDEEFIQYELRDKVEKAYVSTLRLQERSS